MCKMLCCQKLPDHIADLMHAASEVLEECMLLASSCRGHWTPCAWNQAQQGPVPSQTAYCFTRFEEFHLVYGIIWYMSSPTVRSTPSKLLLPCAGDDTYASLLSHASVWRLQWNKAHRMLQPFCSDQWTIRMQTNSSGSCIAQSHGRQLHQPWRVTRDALPPGTACSSQPSSCCSQPSCW